MIIISIGTESLWQQWSFDAFYNGLLKLGKEHKIKVIWAMTSPNIKLPQIDEEVFMITKWLPQAELLQHQAVVTGVCHGGNGGLQDFITAGKPAVGFSHFGD